MSLVWYKRERLAQMDFPTIATMLPLITTTKGGGFYIKVFWMDMYLPLRVVSQNVKGIGA